MSFLSVLWPVVSLALVLLFMLSQTSKRFEKLYVDIGRLQWTIKQRLGRRKPINERKWSLVVLAEEEQMRRVSMIYFGASVLLVIGSLVVYFWDLATGIMTKRKEGSRFRSRSGVSWLESREEEKRDAYNPPAIQPRLHVRIQVCRGWWRVSFAIISAVSNVASCNVASAFGPSFNWKW